MGIKCKSLVVRIDERTYMLLEEISQRKLVGISVVVRTMILKGLNEIVNEGGYLMIEDEETEDSF